MNFLLQTKNTELKDIEAFVLRDILDRRKYEGHLYILSDYSNTDESFKELIPVGNLGFMRDHLKKFYNIDNINPIEIPIELRQEKYLRRYYEIVKREKIPKTGYWFIKNVDTLKSFSATMWIMDEMSLEGLDEGNYAVSEVVDIISEYRCFVHNGKLIGMKHYDGDFTVFPDINIITEMIMKYQNCPKSYSLDIAITSKIETIIIEIHNFISVGTYGFDDSSLIYMYRDGYDFEIKRKT